MALPLPGRTTKVRPLEVLNSGERSLSGVMLMVVVAGLPE